MGFDLGSRKVGRKVRGDSFRDENVVPTQQDFGHHVALIAVIAEVVLEAKIVEAVDARIGFVELTAGILLQRRETFLNEFEPDVAAGFDTELVSFGGDVSHEGHDRGLAAADGTREQDAFFEIEAKAEAGFVIAQEPREQPQDDGMILRKDAEMPTEELDAFAPDPADDLIVVIMAPNSLLLLRCRNVVRLGFHGFRILGRSASSCGRRRASRPLGPCRR